jgi:hypothetical protein
VKSKGVTAQREYNLRSFLNQKKEEDDMKRMIFTGCAILVFASMILVSYADMTREPISTSNLSDLKGKWVGSRTLGPSTALNTEMEISNDSLPLQVKFIFHDVRRLGKSGTTEIRNFKGKINDQGNLVVTGTNFEVELSLYKDEGKMKLEGNYSSLGGGKWGGRGTMSFKK